MSERLQSHFQGGEQVIPEVPIIKRLSERVVVALGMNPSSFSLRGTNTYIVGTGKRRILVDTGDADFTGEYLPVLRRALAESGAEGLDQIIVTHWHRDHIGGVQKVLEAYGPDLPVRKVLPQGGSESVWSDGTEGARSPEAALEGCRLEALRDGEVLCTEGATLRVLHTPGHANDHAALVLEEERAMFTGDNVLGTGTPVVQDLPLYLRSLRRMRAEKPRALYTSHGPAVEEGEAYIADYIAHRTARIEQVRRRLADAGGDGRLTAEDISRGIYTSIPEHLMAPATGNTLQALRVLQEEGAVSCDAAPPFAANQLPQLLGARWQIVAEDASRAKL